MTALDLTTVPTAAHLVEQQLRADRDEAGHYGIAQGLRYRASNARACARKVAYEALGWKPDLELEASALAVFAQGDNWHDLVKRALGHQLPRGWQITYEHEGNADGLVGFHADALVRTWPERARVIVEIKSMARYAFDLAMGRNVRSDEAPGPKLDHVTQAALAAHGTDSAAVWMIYCCKDSGEIADWVIPFAEPVTDPDHVWFMRETPQSLALTELERVAWIDTEHVQEKRLPERAIPGLPIITDPPPRGSKGQPWQCRYCPFQPSCVAHGPGVVAL